MYEILSHIHLYIIGLAFLIGINQLLRKKGNKNHKMYGKVYFILMLATAIITLFMSAKIGPKLFNHFGYLHILSVVVIISVFIAYKRIKQKNIKALHRIVFFTYLGLIIAGIYAFQPGRMVHNILFT